MESVLSLKEKNPTQNWFYRRICRL